MIFTHFLEENLLAISSGLPFFQSMRKMSGKGLHFQEISVSKSERAKRLHFHNNPVGSNSKKRGEKMGEKMKEREG